MKIDFQDKVEQAINFKKIWYTIGVWMKFKKNSWSLKRAETTASWRQSNILNDAIQKDV